MAGDDKTIRSIADEIARYFDDHPNAADTAEGICRWWLARQRSEYSIEDVQAALDGLVARAVVCRRDVPGKPPVYKRGRRSP
jgi:hypothetical protein